MVLAGAALVAEGVSALLVGSAALRLRGEAMPVRDVDMVIEPGAPNLRRVRAALGSFGLRQTGVPPLKRLSELSVLNLATSYGHLDCLLERGREDWERLARNASVIHIFDVEVLVASAADAWELRRRYKG